MPYHYTSSNHIVVALSLYLKQPQVAIFQSLKTMGSKNYFLGVWLIKGNNTNQVSLTDNDLGVYKWLHP